MRGSVLSAEHQKQCIADPVTQLPPGIPMHLLSAPFHNAKTQKHVVAQAIDPCAMIIPETPFAKPRVIPHDKYIPPFMFQREVPDMCPVLDVKLEPSQSVHLQESRGYHARSSEIGHLIMHALCSYRFPMKLQRHIAHVPHQTSHLRSLRRFGYHTEILALALTRILAMLLCLPWLLLGLLLWLCL